MDEFARRDLRQTMRNVANEKDGMLTVQFEGQNGVQFRCLINISCVQAMVASVEEHVKEVIQDAPEGRLQ
jgi:collagenase-like PrtC family protease